MKVEDKRKQVATYLKNLQKGEVFMFQKEFIGFFIRTESGFVDLEKGLYKPIPKYKDMVVYRVNAELSIY